MTLSFEAILDGEVTVEDRLEAERHRAVEDLGIDPLAVHVLEADAVEDPADRGLGMDGAVGALARPVGLRKDALDLRSRAWVAVADNQPLLAVAVGARAEAVAEGGLEVVEEDDRGLHLVGVGVDDEQAVVHGGAPPRGALPLPGSAPTVQGSGALMVAVEGGHVPAGSPLPPPASRRLGASPKASKPVCIRYSRVLSSCATCLSIHANSEFP